MNVKRILFIPVLLALLATVASAWASEEKPEPSASAAAVAAFVNSADRPYPAAAQPALYRAEVNFSKRNLETFK